MNQSDILLLLYSQIVGIQHHPKNDAQDRMTPEECVRAAEQYAKAAEKWADGR